MTTFIARRLVVSLLVLLGATFLVFVLMGFAPDPRAAWYESSDPSAKNKIAALTKALQLDVPIVPRYFHWLKGAVGCLWGQCDLGSNINGAPVIGSLQVAMGATLRLVLFATIIAIVLGVVVGMTSALRQYSGFDYSLTFLAFLFFSLPVFWIAVLLKLYLAIKSNSWLVAPSIPVRVIAALGLVGGVAVRAMVSGGARRRWAAFGGGVLATAGLVSFLGYTRWFATPGISGVGMVLIALLTAFAATAVLAGFRSKRPATAAGVTALVGIGVYFLLKDGLSDPRWWALLILLVATLAVAGGIGAAVGGLYRRQAVKVAMLTGLGCAALIFADHTFQAMPAYAQKVRGVVIGTIGSGTPNFTGTFWMEFLDQFGHLLLPSIAITVISFAAYSRYTRASMLEVMNMDYVRTARAKGLPERTVVVRHALRNALIPITTIMALDFGSVIGGAIITETVFGWSGMGRLFTDALTVSDANTVMGFFLVTGASIVVFNMIADITYGVLDPRIRLT